MSETDYSVGKAIEAVLAPYLSRIDVHQTSKVYVGAYFRRGMDLEMEENTFIGTNATILVPKLVMEKGSQINAGAILVGKDPVFLGKNVVIAFKALLITASDTPKGRFMNDASPETERCIRRGPITVRDGGFIGSGAIIMPNVTIGARSVIFPMCCIKESIEDGVMVKPLTRYIKVPRYSFAKAE